MQYSIVSEPEKALRKKVMSIVTDSTPLEEPKDPETDNVFALYKLLATEEQTAEMHKNYTGGNYGYGHAKQALFELILEKYGPMREKFSYYMDNPKEVDEILLQGATKAHLVADDVLSRVRDKMGY